MNKFIFFVCYFAFFKAKAIVFPTTQGPISNGLGGISCFKSDPFVAYNHCGSLAFLNKNTFSLAFQSHYFVEGLNASCVALNTKISEFQSVGFAYGFLGNSNYNESTAKLSIAHQFSSQFGGGISIDYLRWQLPKRAYPVKHLLTFETGVYAKFNSNIEFAFLFINPIRVKISDFQEERLPFLINSSLFLQANHNCTIGFEWSQNMSYSGVLKFGVKYKINSTCDLSLGMFGKPINPTFGFSYFGKKVNLHLAFTLHPFLGTNNLLGMSHYFNAKHF